MPSLDIANVDASKPTLNIYKQDFVIGNDVQFQRTIIGGLIVPDAPINAWLTIKSSPAVPDGGGVQVVIGLSGTAQGIIVGNLLTFNLGAIPTLQLRAGPLYYYDIKVQVTPSNNIYTLEQGFISFDPEVTDAPIVAVTPLQTNFPPASPKYLFGPNPPPNGPQPVGTRYIVVPPIEGFPAEWVFASSGFWRATSVVSFGD